MISENTSSNPNKELEAWEVAADREIGLVSPYEFLQLAWDQIETVDYIDGRHIQEVCNHLQAVSEGMIQNLVINIIPGSSKTRMCQTFWPVWHWLHHPEDRFYFGSVDPSIPLREANDARNLMASQWFQDRWGDRFQVDTNDPLGEFWSYVQTPSGLKQSGLRFCSSIGGRGIGWHFDIQVIDDPHKPTELTPENLNSVRNWWKHTMSGRARDRKKLRRVVVMQRLHELDLAQFCKEEGYEVLSLPMWYVPEKHSSTVIGGDWRKEKEELLCPARWDEQAARKWEKELDEQAPGQLQQDPMKAGGNIFKDEWLQKLWTEIPKGPLWIQSWDMNFKDQMQVKPGRKPDYVVGQVWCVRPPFCYLVDQVRGRWGFTETVQAVKLLTSKYPQAITKLVEAKANGPAVCNQLQSSIPGFVLLEPEGGKPVRAHACTGFFQGGNIWLPFGVPWLDDYRNELKAFPKGANDDQVDATTQALIWLAPKMLINLGQSNAAMKAILGL